MELNLKIVDCVEIANKIEEEIKQEISKLPYQPCLAVLLIGNDPASHIYVKSILKKCDILNIKCIIIKLNENCEQKEILKRIDIFNKDIKINGILIQLPLPKHIDSFSVFNTISPEKDIEGFNFWNLGKIMHGRKSIFPCTPLSVCKFIEYYELETVGKHIIVINNTINIGKPLSMMLTDKSTVTLCNHLTENLIDICKMGDFLIPAVGKRPNFILNRKFCKKGVKIIDVGINKCSDNEFNKIVGDTDIEDVKDFADIVTKVPNGIGIITIMSLIENLIKVTKWQEEKRNGTMML